MLFAINFRIVKINKNYITSWYYINLWHAVKYIVWWPESNRLFLMIIICTDFTPFMMKSLLLNFYLCKTFAKNTNFNMLYELIIRKKVNNIIWKRLDIISHLWYRVGTKLRKFFIKFWNFKINVIIKVHLYSLEHISVVMITFL